MNAADQKTEEKTHRQSQPKRPQDDPRAPKGPHWAPQGLPHGPHMPPQEHPITHPTLKIKGFIALKQAFLIVALFRHGAARGSTKRDPRIPKAPPREPRCPKAPPRCPNGGLLGAFWGWRTTTPSTPTSPTLRIGTSPPLASVGTGTALPPRVKNHLYSLPVRVGRKHPPLSPTNLE